jgi:hypothetical protein
MYYQTGTDLEPSYNTAIGTEALQGTDETYVVFIGKYNTAVGDQTLKFNTTGNYNTAIGMRSLAHNRSGSHNIAHGYDALFYNSTGDANVAIGDSSLFKNKGNSRSTAIGHGAMYYADDRTSGRWTYNTAVGCEALKGGDAPEYNTGQFNTAIGDKALFSNSFGYMNTAIGVFALRSNTVGIENIGIGAWALINNTEGSANVAIGYDALGDNTTGQGNVATGIYALNDNITGEDNTAYGTLAFSDGTNFNNSTAIGYSSDISASNQVRIGNDAVTSIGGYANWTNVSDARFKTNIKENIAGLDFIMKLRPVSYNLDMDAIASKTGIPDSVRRADCEALKAAEVQTGFIAQEVEQAAREIGFTFHGVDAPKNENDFYGLRYAEFVVPIVKAMQEQQDVIEQLSRQNAELLQRIEKLESQNK